MDTNRVSLAPKSGLVTTYFVHVSHLCARTTTKSVRFRHFCKVGTSKVVQRDIFHCTMDVEFVQNYYFYAIMDTNCVLQALNVLATDTSVIPLPPLRCFQSTYASSRGHTYMATFSISGSVAFCLRHVPLPSRDPGSTLEDQKDCPHGQIGSHRGLAQTTVET